MIFNTVVKTYLWKTNETHDIYIYIYNIVRIVRKLKIIHKLLVQSPYIENENFVITCLFRLIEFVGNFIKIV